MTSSETEAPPRTVGTFVAELRERHPDLELLAPGSDTRRYRYDAATAKAAAADAGRPGPAVVLPVNAGQVQAAVRLAPKLSDDSIDPDRLAADASAEGVEYQRGSFFPSGPGTDSARHLRLAYGDVDAARLDEAVVRLARALRKQQ